MTTKNVNKTPPHPTATFCSRQLPLPTLSASLCPGGQCHWGDGWRRRVCMRISFPALPPASAVPAHKHIRPPPQTTPASTSTEAQTCKSQTLRSSRLCSLRSQQHVEQAGGRSSTGSIVTMRQPCQHVSQCVQHELQLLRTVVSSSKPSHTHILPRPGVDQRKAHNRSPCSEGQTGVTSSTTGLAVAFGKAAACFHHRVI